MIVALALGTTAALLLIAVIVRCRRHQQISTEILIQDTLISAGVGVAVGFVAYPAGWITVAFIAHDSTFTFEMLSEFDPNSIVISMVLGAFITTLFAGFEYVKRILRQDQISTPRESNGPGGGRPGEAAQG